MPHFCLGMDECTDRQPENIMPPAPAIRLAEAEKQIDVDETVLWDVIVAAAMSMQLIRLWGSDYTSTGLNLMLLMLSMPQVNDLTGSALSSSHTSTCWPHVANILADQWWSMPWNTVCTQTLDINTFVNKFTETDCKKITSSAGLVCV